MPFPHPPAAVTLAPAIQSDSKAAKDIRSRTDSHADRLVEVLC